MKEYLDKLTVFSNAGNGISTSPFLNRPLTALMTAISASSRTLGTATGLWVLLRIVHGV